MDANALGAEYALCFYDKGNCDFTLGGVTIANLPWSLQKVNVQSGEADAFVINYYSTLFNAVLTEDGFEMDYYGTMLLNFEAAE